MGNDLNQRYATNIRPFISQTDAQTWRAQYPGVDWYITAESKSAAAEKLAAEAVRRVDSGQDSPGQPDDLLRRHFDQPIPGVYALDLDLFTYLRGRGEHAELQEAFEEAERRRAAGRPYTLSDYLNDRARQQQHPSS